MSHIVLLGGELASDKAMHDASDRALGFGKLIWLTVLIWITITSVYSMITFVNRFLCSVLIFMVNFVCFPVSVDQPLVVTLQLGKSWTISIGNHEMSQLQYEFEDIKIDLNCYDSHNLYLLSKGTIATNILIKNHKMGLTLHQGIHGNCNNKLVPSSLNIDDFAVVGIGCIGRRNIEFPTSFITIQGYNCCQEFKTFPIRTVNNTSTNNIMVICNCNQMSNIGNGQGIEFIIHLIFVIILLFIELITIVIEDFHGNDYPSIHCHKNEQNATHTHQQQKFATEADTKTKEKRFLNSNCSNNSKFRCVIIVLLVPIDIQVILIMFQLFHNYSLEQLSI